jgi:hypothetical protein
MIHLKHVRELSFGTAICAIGLLSLAAAPTTIQGGTIYETGFENPTFLNGSTLQGLDGWASGAPPFLNPQAATITNSVAHTGQQSLQVPGSAMATFAETSPYAAVAPNFHPVDFNATLAGESVLVVRADVRIDGPQETTADSSFAVSIAAVPSEGRYSELVIASNGVLYGLSSFGPEVIIESVDNPLNAWHELEIRLDFESSEYLFRYDSTTFGPFAFEPSFGDDILLRGSLVTYALPDDAGFARADYTARFDNFSIRAVPEPGSAVLSMIAVVGAVGVTTRRGMVRRLVRSASCTKNCRIVRQ